MNARLQAARVIAHQHRPYLAAILMSLRPHESPGLGTFACDERHNLYYDPATLDQWTIPELAAVLEHECWHLALGHFERRSDRDPFTWNIAGDCEINDDPALVTRLPRAAITPTKLNLENGRVAEWYFDHLPRGEVKPRRSGGSAGDEPCTMPQCGGCAGNPGPHEHASEGTSALERIAIRRATAQEIASASRGTVPGFAARWAAEQLAPPRVPWQQLLRGRVRAALHATAGAADYTWRRLGRRVHAAPPGSPLTPGTHSPQPSVLVVLDTSGSMAGTPLREALSEVVGIVRAVGSVRLLSYDAAPQWLGEVRSARDLGRLEVGYGGTSMAAACEHADRMRADLLILLTDGYTDWPGALRTPIITVCTTTQAVPHHLHPIHIPCTS